MTDYTHEYGSNFPNEILELVGYEDVTNDIPYEDLSDIRNIITLRNAGNYKDAQKIITRNPELKKYMFGAAAINRIDEETRNIEIYAKRNAQNIYYDNNFPVQITNNDVWIRSELNE